MTLVPAHKTPITPADVAQALRSAWSQLFGGVPSDATIALLMAQSALETGRWRSCWNWNLGNIKPGSKWQGDTCQFSCNEVIDGKVVWFNPPHPQTTFRAYADLAAAAADYLWLLHRRFTACWMHVLRPDPVAFSQALKRQGYYTAPEPPYTRAVASLFREYLPLVVSLADPVPVPAMAPAVPDRDLETLALSIAAYDAVSAVREEMHDTEPAPAPGDDDGQTQA